MIKVTKYIKTIKGNIPLIISVPHGGSIELETIPKRLHGVLGIDKNTIDLANELATYVNFYSKQILSIEKKPSFVVSYIHRNRVDLNRSEASAFTKDSSFAKEIYDTYHNSIKELISSNLKSLGRSLLIDIHGFETEKRPLGFRDVDVILGTNNLNSLFPNGIPKKNWGENLRGYLIKSLLANKISTAPGAPKRREYILTGGYITQKYGASQISKNQAIQIEFSDRIRISDKGLRIKVLKLLAEIFLKYSLLYDE